MKSGSCRMMLGWEMNKKKRKPVEEQRKNGCKKKSECLIYKKSKDAESHL